MEEHTARQNTRTKPSNYECKNCRNLFGWMRTPKFLPRGHSGHRKQRWEPGSVPGRELCQLCCGHPASTGHSALHPAENSSSSWRWNLIFRGK